MIISSRHYFTVRKTYSFWHFSQISMNVLFLILVKTMEHVTIPTAPTYASVQMAGMDTTVNKVLVPSIHNSCNGIMFMLCQET